MMMMMEIILLMVVMIMWYFFLYRVIFDLFYFSDDDNIMIWDDGIGDDGNGLVDGSDGIHTDFQNQKGKCYAVFFLALKMARNRKKHCEKRCWTLNATKSQICVSFDTMDEYQHFYRTPRLPGPKSS